MATEVPSSKDIRRDTIEGNKAHISIINATERRII